jgi:SLOG family YspA-like protein
MRVLVCGGREYADREKLAAVLADLRQARGITVFIAGGARGADTLAEEWAKAQSIACDIYMADWDGLGRKPDRPGTSVCSTKESLPSSSL